MAKSFQHGTANRLRGTDQAREVLAAARASYDPEDGDCARALEAVIEWEICDGNWERYIAIVGPVRDETGGRGRAYRDALRTAIAAERAKAELAAEQLAEAAEDAALWDEVMADIDRFNRGQIPTSPAPFAGDDDPTSFYDATAGTW